MKNKLQMPLNTPLKLGVICLLHVIGIYANVTCETHYHVCQNHHFHMIKRVNPMVLDLIGFFGHFCILFKIHEDLRYETKRHDIYH